MEDIYAFFRVLLGVSGALADLSEGCGFAPIMVAMFVVVIVFVYGVFYCVVQIIDRIVHLILAVIWLVESYWLAKHDKKPLPAESPFSKKADKETEKTDPLTTEPKVKETKPDHKNILK